MEKLTRKLLAESREMELLDIQPRELGESREGRDGMNPVRSPGETRANQPLPAHAHTLSPGGSSKGFALP